MKKEDVEYINRKVLNKLNTPISKFFTIGKNPNSPMIGDDNRDWYMCDLCDYASLSKQGIVIHLSKFHKISSKKSKETIIELSIKETLKYIERN